jgi:hypothetical protein
LIGCGNFILKCIILVTVMIWVRWTLPRLRIDQVMKTCLKYCTPIAAVMFLGAALWTYKFPGGVWLKPTRPLGAIRESAFAENLPAVKSDKEQDAKNTASQPAAAPHVASANQPRTTDN